MGVISCYICSKVLEPTPVENQIAYEPLGTVNRWNPVQNRNGGTGTVLPSPNKLIGKVVILSSMKKANMGFFIINCMH